MVRSPKNDEEPSMKSRKKDVARDNLPINGPCMVVVPTRRSLASHPWLHSSHSCNYHVRPWVN